MSALRLSLRAGERVWVNGAVLRADRKVGLELLNDVTFLLEQHVMKPEQTTTPLRQLYFMVQTLLVEPAAAHEARARGGEPDDDASHLRQPRHSRRPAQSA